MYLDMSIDGNKDSIINIYSGSFNALPPYECIQEVSRKSSMGNENKVVTKLVLGRQIYYYHFRNSEILQVDTANCTIPNYGLRDDFVDAYVVSELDAGKSSILPYRSYSFNNWKRIY